MNRTALSAFALLCFSLVACTGDAVGDEDDAETEVTVQTGTDRLEPQEAAQKKPAKGKEQEFMIVKMENVLVSSY